MACAPEEPPRDHQNRPAVGKAKGGQTLFAVAAQNLRADGRAGIDALFAKAARRFREGAEYLARKGRAELVGQPRRHIRFVQNHAHPVQPRAVDHGTETKPPLEKTTSGFSCFISFEGLTNALHHFERIGEVFDVEVAPQLARGHAVIRHFRNGGDEALFHAVCLADVMHVPAVRQKTGDQRQVRRDVAAVPPPVNTIRFIKSLPMPDPSVASACKNPCRRTILHHFLQFALF